MDEPMTAADLVVALWGLAHRADRPILSPEDWFTLGQATAVLQRIAEAKR